MTAQKFGICSTRNRGQGRRRDMAYRRTRTDELRGTTSTLRMRYSKIRLTKSRNLNHRRNREERPQQDGQSATNQPSDCKRAGCSESYTRQAKSRRLRSKQLTTRTTTMKKWSTKSNVRWRTLSHLQQPATRTSCISTKR
jgi:hypothetical protein